MEWTIKLMYAVLLTTVTGSVLFIIWLVIGRILEKMGFTNVVYLLLRGLLIFWMVPISFLILEHKNNQLERGGEFLFFYTKAINYLSMVLLAAWAVSIVASSVKYLRSVLTTHRRFQRTYECTDEVNELFYEVCGKMHIKRGKVKLLQSCWEEIPVSVGVFSPRVVIPDCEYSRTELEVIFVHELTHYKHRDELLKHIIFIIFCFNCYNPLMHVLMKQIEIWGECSCDYDAVKVFGRMRKYFQTIFDMTESEQEPAALTSPLFDKRSELEYRILQMRRSKNMSKKSKFVAALCVMAMAVTSTTAIYGATNAAKAAYLGVYNATVKDVSEISRVLAEDGLTEYTVSGLDSNVMEEEDEVSSFFGSNNAYHFGWDVPKNTAKRSGSLQISKNQSIQVSTACSSDNVTYRIGIVQPNGQRRYVEGTEGLTHTFTASKTGTYYVYVQNMSTTTDIEVVGGYSWQ